MKRAMLCTLSVVLVAICVMTFGLPAHPDSRPIPAPAVVVKTTQTRSFSDLNQRSIARVMEHFTKQMEKADRLPLLAGETFPGELMAQAGGGAGGTAPVPGCTADVLPTCGCGPDGYSNADIQLCQAMCQEACQTKLDAACAAFVESFNKAAIALITCQAQATDDYNYCLAHNPSPGDPFWGYSCGVVEREAAAECAKTCDRDLQVAQMKYYGSALLALFEQQACMEACCGEEE